MPRQKLSEYRAKQILTTALELEYTGVSVDANELLPPQLSALPSESTQFVIKVDEGVKGRFKKGLVVLNVSHEGIAEAVQSLQAKGYRWLIIEPMVAHEQSAERYLSFMSDHEAIIIRYTSSGGIDIEAHTESIKSLRYDPDGEKPWQDLAQETGLSVEQLETLATVFIQNYLVFMEINPYLVNGNGLQLLDSAIEVDDAAAFFVESWHSSDFRRHEDRPLTQQEKTVIELDENSPASFKLSVLEPNGSIFLLLSGGGASVVVADEVYNQGFGKQLANYGEYSGNPNTEETYIYTKALMELMLASSAPHKVLFIGGAVANFTDVAQTFAGVIQAINEHKEQLREQAIKVYVRRGGPNQEKGLKRMSAVLEEDDLLGAVHGPEMPLTEAVGEALKEISDS
jgi:ATP-citrate lyase beta-subunit